MRNVLRICNDLSGKILIIKENFLAKGLVNFLGNDLVSRHSFWLDTSHHRNGLVSRHSNDFEAV